MSGNAMSDLLAEPLLQVDTREELVYLLGQACEMEPAVASARTIKPSEDPDLLTVAADVAEPAAA